MAGILAIHTTCEEKERKVHTRRSTAGARGIFFRPGVWELSRQKMKKMVDATGNRTVGKRNGEGRNREKGKCGTGECSVCMSHSMGEQLTLSMVEDVRDPVSVSL